jgi:hypothetical protein
MNSEARLGLIDTKGLDRRILLKGIATFLGYPLLSTINGCTPSKSALPERLSAQTAGIEGVQKLWKPPPSVIELGREVINNHHVTPDIQALLKALSEPSKGQKRTPVELAEAIRRLHHKAAKMGSWVEIKGWRLTTVEAAAYALSSFALAN